MSHPPHAGLDPLALKWAVVMALAFSISTLPDRWRKQPAEERKLSLFLGVILETVLGGLVGGVLFAWAIPEWLTSLRGEGTRAALSVIGAALGPHLGGWIVKAGPQAIPALVQKYTGIKISIEGGKGDDGEAKS